MNPQSQVLLRHAELFNGRLLLAGTPDDALLASLPVVIYNLTQYVSAGLLAGLWQWQINRRLRKLRS